MGGDEAEGHGGTERDTAGGIVPAHHAGHVIAAGIETGNRLLCGIEHLRAVIDLQARKGAQTAHHDLDGIKRACLHRTHAGIGQAAPLGGRAVTLYPVIGGLAFGKIWIHPVGAQGIVTGEGGLQARPVNAAGFGQLVHALAALEITVFEPWADRHRSGFDRAQAITAQEGVIADQPGLGLFTPWSGGEQILHQVMIGIGLVAEALSVCGHGDQAGFGPFDQMRKMRHAAIGTRHQ